MDSFTKAAAIRNTCDGEMAACAVPAVFSAEVFREKACQAVGEASSCWSRKPRGIFQAERARKLVDELESLYQRALNRIHELENRLDYERKLRDNARSENEFLSAKLAGVELAREIVAGRRH